VAETEKGTYIDFEQRPATPIVPEEWIIRNRKSGDVLGAAAYYARWRRWTVEFQQFTVFDSLCLREIADFLDRRLKGG